MGKSDIDTKRRIKKKVMTCGRCERKYSDNFFFEIYQKMRLAIELFASHLDMVRFSKECYIRFLV